MPTGAEVRAQLTAPGAPFEVTIEEVRGIPMRVYRNRLRSLREVAAIALARGDDHTALVHGERRWSSARFIREANSVSATLAAVHDIAHGDRVAVLAANSAEWCLAFWGTVDLGAVLVGLNGWWKADEILYGLADSGARVLVADRGRIARIAGSLGSLDLDAVFLTDCDPADVGLDGDPRVHRFATLLERPTDDLPTTPIAEDDPAVIFYTSGTTGRSKGAISTHRSMLANLQNTLFGGLCVAMQAGIDPLGGRSQAASLLTTPLFHVSGCHSNLVVGTTAGSKLVIPEGRFDPEDVMRLIEREEITSFAAVPTMVWRIVEHPARHDHDLSSVTTVSYGGSPTAGEMQRRVRETFPNLKAQGNAYGLTETSSAATYNGGPDLDAKPTSVGPPFPVVELRVVDAAGDDVGVGTTGEIWIKGPIVMPGYWGKPEATAEVLTPDGWLRSGDLGHLDEDGFLYVTDRAKDMIIRGGENVYCVEIENRLVEHPAIADAAVVGVPHPTLGEEVKAVVQVAPGASLDADEVRRWVAETLADFKVPTYVELRDERLPRNASGKLLKQVLRGEAEVAFAETM